MNQHANNGTGAGSWKWVLVGFLAVAAFFLWTEHKAHALGILPYLLLAACPLLHLVHHGHAGHGHHGHPHGEQRPSGKMPADATKTGDRS